MRYASIRKMDISNGEGIGVSLFVQGCPIHCKGCFQPETWDFLGGKEYTVEQKSQIFDLLKPNYITRFSILGGEPLAKQNIWELFLLCSQIKDIFPNKEIWLWSGYTWEQLRKRINDTDFMWPEIDGDIYLSSLLKQLDVLITGPFIEEEKDLTLKWRGSRNQQILYPEDFNI